MIADMDRDFFWVILGRGPRAFQIGKISVVNPLKLENLLWCTIMSFLVNEKQVSHYKYFCRKQKGVIRFNGRRFSPCSLCVW